MASDLQGSSLQSSERPGKRGPLKRAPGALLLSTEGSTVISWSVLSKSDLLRGHLCWGGGYGHRFFDRSQARQALIGSQLFAGPEM